jgi:apolipoprotein N-acyltransferase
VEKGADFVVNITNEALFGEIAFPYQMLSQCSFRAVENRVNLVRAANTGISCFINPYGRITGKVANERNDIFVAGTLTQDIFLSPAGTFYTHYGDVFAFGCVALSIGLVIWSFVRRSSKNMD